MQCGVSKHLITLKEQGLSLQLGWLNKSTRYSLFWVINRGVGSKTQFQFKLGQTIKSISNICSQHMINSYPQLIVHWLVTNKSYVRSLSQNLIYRSRIQLLYTLETMEIHIIRLYCTNPTEEESLFSPETKQYQHHLHTISTTIDSLLYLVVVSR